MNGDIPNKSPKGAYWLINCKQPSCKGAVYIFKTFETKI